MQQFNTLCARHGPELVSRWEAMDTEAQLENDHWVSVFCSKCVSKGEQLYISDNDALTTKPAPPMQGRVFQQLCQQEYIAELSGLANGAGVAQFINTGLQIEAEQ
jgi:hypothetical protein